MLRGLLSQSKNLGRGRTGGRAFFPGRSETSEHLAEDFIFGGDKTKLEAPAALTVTPRTPSATTSDTPGLLNFYGFETGNNDDEVAGLIYTGSFTGIDSTAARGSGYGLLIDTTAGGNATFRLGRHDYVTGQATSLSVSEVFFTFWFRANAFPDPGDILEIAYARDGGGGDKWKITIDDVGNIDVYNNTGDAIFGSTEKITLGNWRKFEIWADSAGGSGSLRFKIYDNNVTTPVYDSGTISTATGNDYDYIALGTITGLSSGAIDWNYDDCILHGSGFYDNSNLRVAAIKPNAAGDSSDWSAGTGASDYTQIDELPSADTDYIKSTTSSGKKTHLVNLQNRSTASIYGINFYGVKVFANIREDSSVSSETQVTLKTNGGEHYAVGVNSTTTNTPVSGFWENNPSTGTRFTASEIDALQAGVTELQAVAVRTNTLAAFLLLDEKLATSLPAPTALNLIERTPGATVTQNNRSSIPLASLTLSALTPGATTTTTAGHTCTMPLATLTLTANTPSATKTEHHRSTIPLSTLTITPRTPVATTTEHHRSTIPLAALTLTPRTPGATTTTNHRSTMASAALVFTASTPGATVTTNHRSTMASAALTFTGRTPGTTTTEHHRSTVPLLALTMTALIPGATKTEHHRASIPAAALTMTALIPGATVATNHRSTIPAANLTISALTPTITVGASHRTTMAAASLTISPQTPQATTTTRHYSSIGGATLSLTQLNPGATKTENKRSTIPLSALSITGNAPQITVLSLNSSTIPLASISLSAQVPSATKTDNNYAAIPTRNFDLQSWAPDATTTEAHRSLLSVLSVTISAFTPQFVRSQNDGVVVKWFSGKDLSLLHTGKRIKTLVEGSDESLLATGKDISKLLRSGKDENGLF